jgi:hypothetical protein
MVFLLCICRTKKEFCDFFYFGDIDHFMIEINEKIIKFREIQNGFNWLQKFGFGYRTVKIAPPPHNEKNDEY